MEKTKMDFTEEDKRKIMLRFLGLRSSVLEDVARNKDGEYWGMKKGASTFTKHLGRPGHNKDAMRRCQHIWLMLDIRVKAALFERLSNPKYGEPIPLSDFGIEEGHA